MWSYSPHIMFLRFIQVVAWISTFYWMYHFSYSLIDGRLGCLPFPAIVNKATMNVCVQVLCGRVSTFLGHVPKSGNAGTYCNSFLITLHIKVIFGT